MSALFVAASNQYIYCTNPVITDYPFTVGCWIRLTAVGATVRAPFALTSSTSDTNYLHLRMSSGEVMQAVACAGSTENLASAGTAITPGQWLFVLARFISSTQRRVARFGPNLAMTVGSTVTARAPTGLDTMSVGAFYDRNGVFEPWDGEIAEWWLARGDVFSDGLDVNSAFMHALAYGGPFSMPQIKVVDYFSFRSGPVAGRLGHRSFTVHNWAPVAAPTLGVHPPLPYWHARPDQTQTQLVI